MQLIYIRAYIPARILCPVILSLCTKLLIPFMWLDPCVMYRDKYTNNIYPCGNYFDYHGKLTGRPILGSWP